MTKKGEVTRDSSMEKLLDEYRKQGREVETYTQPSGQIVHVVGKPDIKKLVKKAMELIYD